MLDDGFDFVVVACVVVVVLVCFLLNTTSASPLHLLLEISY